MSDREPVFGALHLPKEYLDLLYTEIRSQMTAELLHNMEGTQGDTLELAQWGLATLPAAVLRLESLTCLNLEVTLTLTLTLTVLTWTYILQESWSRF